MAAARRFYVRSPDGAMISGYDDRQAAQFVAREYGDGAHLVDTKAQAYHPMVEEVIGGELTYLEFGGWDSGRLSVERDLIEGIKKGHIAIVHAFLKKGADPDATDDNGGPALLWAVARGRAEIVQLLLDHGADAGRRDATGKSALDLAVERDDREMAGLLKAAGAES